MAVAKTIETAKRGMTEDEFMRLPRDGRKYELLDGEAKEVPTGFEHDVLGMRLGFLLMPHVKGRGFLTGSQAGFRMTSGNIRCPDVAFTRKERLPDGKPPQGFCEVGPDLAIEIISPSEEPADKRRKLQEYFDSGAQQVWHLHPSVKRLIVYHSPEESVAYEEDAEITGSDLLPDFHCRVAELFEIE
jgi:Uma2 family endonuclease